MYESWDAVKQAKDSYEAGVFSWDLYLKDVFDNFLIVHKPKQNKK